MTNNLAFLKALPTPVVTLEAQSGQILFVNSAAQKLLADEHSPGYESQLSSLCQRVARLVSTEQGRESLRQEKPLVLEQVQLLIEESMVLCDVTLGYTTPAETVIYCIIEQYDVLRLLGGEQAFLQVMQTLSPDLLFRFDVRTKMMRFFGNIKRDLGLGHSLYAYPQSLLQSGRIHPEDKDSCLKFLEQVQQGDESPCYLRMQMKGKGYVWYKKEYKIICDSKGRPLEVMGKFVDAQQQKDLEEQIRIDPLTNCMRKVAFETLVARYMDMQPHEQGALFIVDLDNFKAVNDNLGHQFGDMVLRGVGDKLRTIFRSSDFVGRIGGDEFMVFMKDVRSVEAVDAKAKDILAALDATYTGGEHALHTSASVGIAEFPKDGKTFQELYDHADKALFDAKNRGKNACVRYHTALAMGTMKNTLPYDVATRTLAQHFDTTIVGAVFNLLLETKEMDISLQAVLELLGKRFSVSRCYVFEVNPTQPDTYQNTYEWCNEGVEGEQEHLQAVPGEMFQELFDLATDDGILYCNDLSTITHERGRQVLQDQGIKSLLHSYITAGGKISYVVGFDQCDTNRIWSPIEVSTLLHATKIITLFLRLKNWQINRI